MSTQACLQENGASIMLQLILLKMLCFIDFVLFSLPLSPTLIHLPLPCLVSMKLPRTRAGSPVSLLHVHADVGFGVGFLFSLSIGVCAGLRVWGKLKRVRTNVDVCCLLFQECWFPKDEFIIGVY